MKRLFTLFTVLGLAGLLALASFPVSQSTSAAQDGVTDDPTSSMTVTLAGPGTTTISGNIASRGGTVIFVGEDSFEKIINVVVNQPTVATFELNWPNRQTDLDTILWKVAEGGDPTLVADPEAVNASASPLGAAAFPEKIGPNVLLPGRYVLGITNFECDTCGANGTPIDGVASDYTLTITTGGNAPIEVNVDNGILGILRFRTGLGRTYVNRFSLGEQLGLSGPRQVTISGVRANLFNPSTFGVARPDIPGQSVRFIAFTAPAGTTAPPDNPTLVLDRNLTVPGADGYIDFALNPPLVVDSNQELFLGYFMADPANNGMQFNIDTLGGTSRGRSFFSGGTGTSSAALSGWNPDEGTAAVPAGGNAMHRLIVNP
jgi:hypothetical protein